LAAPQPDAPAPLNEGLDKYQFDGPLAIFLVDEPEFVGGEAADLKVLVMRATADGRVPAANVKVNVKTLSTAFSPGKVETSTDESGLATVSLKFPNFRSGRAAVLVQIEHEGIRVELRRIILPGR
jgi:hypothetical protein